MRWFLLTAALAMSACSATRSLAPLGKDQGALTLSVGGPINANLGVGIPLPISSIGYAHGVSDKTNVYGAFYPTGLATFGVPGIDIGVAHEVLEPLKARPRIMVDGTLFAFFGDNAGGDPPAGIRLFPNVGSTVSWPIKEHALFFGADLFFQAGPAFRAHFTPKIGGQVRTGRVGILLQYAWWAPYVDNVPLAPVWIGPGGFGASAFQLGIDIRLGPRKDK